MGDKNVIAKCLFDMIKAKFNISFKDENEELYNLPLTGKAWKLFGMELVILLLEIEKMYTIRFKEEDLLQYQFCTINEIADLILKYKSKNGNSLSNC